MRLGSARRVVLGIGNPDRGDDAAGRFVARRLRGTLPHDVELTETSGEATALIALLHGAEAAYVVDACHSGAAAGTVRRFDLGEAPLPEVAFGLSIHGLGLATAVELARALGQLPPRCVIYAIEAASFETGAPLSAAVAEAVEQVAAQLRTEIAERGQAEG